MITVFLSVIPVVNCNIRDAVHISLYYYSLLMCHYIACILLFTLVFCHFTFLPVWRINLIIIVTIAQHYGFVANLVLNQQWKNFENPLTFGTVIAKNSSRFFETQCINKWKVGNVMFAPFELLTNNECSSMNAVNSSQWTRHGRKKHDGELVTDAIKMTVNSSQKIPCDEFTEWRVHWLPGQLCQITALNHLSLRAVC